MLHSMDDVKQALNKDVCKVVFSNCKEETCKYRRVEILPTTVKGKSVFQISCYTEKQVFQENISKDKLCSTVEQYFPAMFQQMHVLADGYDYSFRMTKKDKLLKNVSKYIVATSKKRTQDHNRKKNYLLEEGVVIPPLVDMGVFTKEGKVVASMYDKYKQINRFIELVDDLLSDETKQLLHIIDFGCGKSYLTFILYYYLVEIKHKQVQITGLDLKEDVIKKCNATAAKYGYEGIHFELGDINGYHTDVPVDMVVSLHACDTATDYALYNAVTWNAKYIMSVPCCQHEVNGQIQSDDLTPIMEHGILKERFAALSTDAIRGSMLTYRGYRTQVMEFVDLAHSPKNLLIRAVKSNVSKEKRKKALAETERMCRMLNIEPSIYKLLR